ncbi:MAG: BTAD domain-containing putative transcriptional regulator [Gemmatimonadota bacterium]
MSAPYLKTLGTLSLHVEGPDTEPVLRDSKSLILMALLAIAPDRCLRRDHLAELLWPGVDHRRARRSLRQSLYYLSRRGGRDLIRVDNAHLETGRALGCDAWAVEAALSAGDYETVVALFGGRFLESVERKLGREVQQWVDVQNEKLRAGVGLSFRRLIRRCLERGHGEAALRYARRYAEWEPLDDRAQLDLVRTLRALGDDAGAVRAYEGYRALLRTAVDDVPSEEMERSVARVREAVFTEAAWPPAGPLNGEGAGAAMVVEAGAGATADGAEADGGSRSSAVSARPGAGRVRWASPAAVLAAGLVGLVLGGLFLSTALGTLVRRNRGVLPNTTVADLAGVLTVTLDGASGDAAELHLEGGNAALIPRAAPASFSAIPSPDGRWYARIADGDHGVDLELVDARTGRVLTLLSGPADERPAAWSPDGRRLLVGHGLLPDGSDSYRDWLAAYDLETGRSRVLVEDRGGVDGRAAWSPDGSRLAYLRRSPSGSRLWVSDADGSHAHPVSPASAWVVSLAWSTQGRHLVYGVRERDGSNLFVVRPDGGDLERITDGPGERRTPVWLSETVLAFVLDVDGGPDVWAINRLTGARRRLTHGPPVLGIHVSYPTGEEAPWIERLELEAPEWVAVGETARFSIRLFDAAGRSLSALGRPVRISVADPSILRLSGRRTLEALRAGRTRIVVSVGGWRADTAEIAVRPLVEAPLVPAFEERWSGGLRDDVWTPIGDPASFVRTGGGPDGAGIFVNNGDQNYVSGVASRRSFALGGGLTVEWWARLPFTGEFFQNLALHLLAGPADPSAQTPYENSVLRLGAVGHDGTWTLIARPRLVSFPLGESPEEWHRYALQVEPDGTVDVFRDDRLLHRARSFLAPAERPRRVFLGLGGNSLGAEVQLGTLRVYEGTKYRVPGSW